MRLRKITIDNSVKYIPSTISWRTENSPKDPKTKFALLPGKQNGSKTDITRSSQKNFHKKNLLKTIAGAGFGLNI